MTKLAKSLLGLSVSGSISSSITYLERMRGQIVEKKPELKDAKTQPQLNWRHMFLKVVALWHALSAAEKLEWESAARPKHMTGYAWFVSQALRPNPGIYLPLQGGTMAGIIDMDGYAIQDLLDPVAAQDGDTKAARDAAIAAAIGGSLTCDIYGWDGAFWQKILVESTANPNLRVKLYDGANSIDGLAATPDNYNPTGLYNLGVRSTTMLWDSVAIIAACKSARRVLDNDAGAHFAPVALMSYDGATWDRLRCYPTGILKVGRAELPSTTLRKVAAGAVVAGARKLFWISCSPDAPGAEFELTDAIAGGGAVVFDHFDPDKHSEIINFDPPMKFSTGIWTEKFDHIHSLVFCYI